MPNVIPQTYQLVPTDSIFEHPDNPNRGDEDLMDESLEANDFFGACLVQASSRLILAGNHRHRRAVVKGMEFVPVIFADVDDDHARRIMLVDNESTRRGKNNERALLAVLDSLARGAADVGDALRGTGYDAAQYMELIERLNAGPLVPDVEPQGEPGTSADHRIEIECSADAFATIGPVLDRWAELQGVTVSIT